MKPLVENLVRPYPIQKVTCKYRRFGDNGAPQTEVRYFALDSSIKLDELLMQIYVPMGYDIISHSAVPVDLEMSDMFAINAVKPTILKMVKRYITELIDNFK